MKIRYMTKEEYAKTRRGYNKLQPILDEFMKSGHDVAEIDIAGAWKSTKNAQASLTAAIRRSGYAITTHAEGDKVYLIRTFKDAKD